MWTIFGFNFRVQSLKATSLQHRLLCTHIHAERGLTYNSVLLHWPCLLLFVSSTGMWALVKLVIGLSRNHLEAS